MKVTAFLPVKAVSERIDKKNTTLLDGEPLFLRTLRKLTQCSEIDEVVLDTESSDLRSLAEGINCKFLCRDFKLASNATDGHELFLNEVNSCDADICVQVLCTSPFLEIETINRAIRILKENENYDSVVAIRKDRFYLWDEIGPLYDMEKIPNSCTLPDTIIEGMNLYAVRSDVARALGRRIGKAPFRLELTPLEAIDVNWPADFELATLIATGLREKEHRLLRTLSKLLSSALLSDVLDSMGLEGVFPAQFSLNFPSAKVFGRAKTLEIVPCVGVEDGKGIYDGLKLYDYIGGGDILVIENPIVGGAYFGELNAHLAMRAGASAAVVNGITRDQSATSEIGFPVFSKGNYCRDTRGRGRVKSINSNIMVDGILVESQDLIFGDCDGIVRVPKSYEKEVVQRALDRLKNEQDILRQVSIGDSPAELVDRFGFF